MKNKKTILISHIYLIIMCLIVLVPVILLVLSSFTASQSLAGSTLIPEKLSIVNYVRLFEETNYVKWFFNTLEIAIASVICSVFVTMITAWIMSRFKFKGRKTSLIAILLLSMFPTFLSMTAIYTLFQILGLIGKPISMIIIYVAGAIPFNTWLVKGYLDGIPMSIDEAASIDGCSRFKIFFTMIIPLSKPIITYCAVSQFMTPWMDYILPSMLLSGDENKTLAVGLYGLISRSESSEAVLFAAGAVLIAVPITLMFIAFQKYLVTGVSAGADK